VRIAIHGIEQSAGYLALKVSRRRATPKTMNRRSKGSNRARPGVRGKGRGEENASGTKRGAEFGTRQRFVMPWVTTKQGVGGGIFCPPQALSRAYMDRIPPFCVLSFSTRI